MQPSDIITPVAILATRTVKKHGSECEQWLIQWKDGQSEEATWEDALTIKSQFPESSLEDTTLSEGGSNDANSYLGSHDVNKPRIWKVHSIRVKGSSEKSG